METLPESSGVVLLGVIFLAMLANGSLGFPPSEVVLIGVGAACAEGRCEPLAALLLALIGNVFGTTGWYMLARRKGRDWILKPRRLFQIRAVHLERLDRIFVKYGWCCALFGRWIPGIRSQISIPCGLARMPLRPFILFTTIGNGVWIVVWIALGAYVPDGVGIVRESAYRHVGAVCACATVLVVALCFLRARRDRRGLHDL